MMRNNLINFAEFERETIAARVADAYVTRSTETGFYQGGRIYYGYAPERHCVNGKNGSVLVPTEQAEVVKIAYNMYQKNDVSLANIIDYLRENNIETEMKIGNKSKSSVMCKSNLCNILKSPLYVRADKEVYQFLISKGFEILDDISEFDGVHGLFRHKRNDSSEYIKIGYHEGVVDSDVWLAVQDKKSHNKKYPNNGGAKSSWLVGLVKCGKCGYALMIQSSFNAAKTKNFRYFLDRGKESLKGCTILRPSIKPDQVEEIVFNAMKERLATLEIARKEKEKPDSETEKLKAEIIRADNEIRSLIDKLAQADSVLFEYINERVKSLHNKKSEIEEKLRSKTRKNKAIDTAPLSDPLRRWEELTVEEKHSLAVTMIEVVYVSDENGIDIRFAV